MKNKQFKEDYATPEIKVMEVSLSDDFFAGSGGVSDTTDLKPIEGGYW